MFNLKAFIVKNIIDGIKNGTFSKEYGNIMAVNYLVKGILVEEDVATIDEEITAWAAAQVVETPAEPSEEEDVVVDTPTEPSEEENVVVETPTVIPEIIEDEEEEETVIPEEVPEIESKEEEEELINTPVTIPEE